MDPERPLVVTSSARGGGHLFIFSGTERVFPFDRVLADSNQQEVWVLGHMAISLHRKDMPKMLWFFCFAFLSNPREGRWVEAGGSLRFGPPCHSHPQHLFHSFVNPALCVWNAAWVFYRRKKEISKPGGVKTVPVCDVFYYIFPSFLLVQNV